MNSTQRAGTGLVTLVLGFALAGCGTPGAPQPPSLNLPDRVNDLRALRNGDEVTLAWTVPRRNTDKLPLKTDVAVRICRSEGGAACIPVADLNLAPAANGSYRENLPSALTHGAARRVSYFVELANRHGRSAGLSNSASILAGQAPEAIENLSAEVRKSGVALRWTPGDAQVAVRLERKLLTPGKTKVASGPLAPSPQPAEQKLLVQSDTGRALDKDIDFGNTYEYTAQRIARVTIDGATLELASAPCLPVRVAALDVFPPAAPTGLYAVATARAPGVQSAIDLNWQPVTEKDLAGYIVYRREGSAAWQRVSPEQPPIAPAFHDPQVQPGHTYQYAVSAIDKAGRESSRSAEAEETVPE